MKMMNQFKQRRSPVLVISVLMLIYLWFFSYPEIDRLFRRFWDGDAFQFLVGIELLCVLAGSVIWILSVFVTWAAFQTSGKKAYLFIFAYFLLPLAVQPSGRIMQNFVGAQQARGYLSKQADGHREPTVPRLSNHSRTIAHRDAGHNFFLPVGPLLLLAGVWCLYKKEERECDEQTTGESLRAPCEDLR